MKLVLYFFILFSICVVSPLHGQNVNPEPSRVTGISTDKYHEFAPTISADGNTMIIQSNRNSKYNIDHWELFESSKNKYGVWSEAVPITNINEKCQFLAGPCLSYDGNRVYFTAFIKGKTTSEDIFYSERINKTEWSEPISVGAPVNSEGFEGFPSISADGNSLYFMRVSFIPVDKKTKENCFEIYVSTKKPNGEWGEPEALPGEINNGCTRDPRIMADNHTLIFSSITPGGKGKYDLFQSRRNADGSWSPAKSLDFINSPENDQSPTISAAGDLIYYYTRNDIYAMPIPLEYRQLINVTVQGFVRSEKDSSVLPCVVVVRNVVTNEKITVENNPNDGRFSLVLAAGGHFIAEFINPQYVKQVMDLDFRKQDVYREIDVNVSLKSTYVAKVITMDQDLKFPVTSHVQVSDQFGNLVWRDSVKAGKDIPELTLHTGNQYTLLATAINYGEASKSINFVAQTFKSDTTLTLFMVHEKVSIATEVTDITSNARVKTRVVFNNTSADEVLISESGEAVYLRKGDRYQVVTSSDKAYFFSTSTLVAGEGESAAEGNFQHVVTLTPIRQGASLTLHNIHFETNSAELKKSSFAELNHVIDLLKQNPTMIIEIAAHTDDVGNEKYNIKLSERRAQSVIDFLKKKGIPETRFEARGFGKSKPVTANNTEEGRAKNRRVELTILRL